MEFQRVINNTFHFSSNKNTIVTIDIRPNRPETGFGYVKKINVEDNENHKVTSFMEKPILETANKYLLEGNCFWNTGIFVWNINTIITAIRKYKPAIVKKWK